MSTAARHVLRYISPGVFKLDGQDYVFSAPNNNGYDRVQEILELIVTTLPIIVQKWDNGVRIVDSLKEYDNGNSLNRFIVNTYTSGNDISKYSVMVNISNSDDISYLSSTISMYVSVDPNPV